MSRRLALLASISLLACSSSTSSPQAVDDRDATLPPDDGSAQGDGAQVAEPDEEPVADLGLVINELMASNDGTWVDEHGSVDDWLELYNTGTTPVRLRDFTLEGKKREASALPDLTLAPGEVVLLWADGEPEQGQNHLPFKLKKEGETLRLRRARDGVLADRVSYVDLPANVSEARLPDGAGPFARCRYATPTRRNGATCEPTLVTGLDGDAVFADYVWPSPKAPTSPLIVSELALKPASFVELVNVSTTSVALGEWALTVDAHTPGTAWPSALNGSFIDLPDTTLAPGERVVVKVSDSQIAALAADASFEGVATLFQQVGLRAEVRDRVDFNRWPEGAVLARTEDHSRFRYCTNQTEGAANTCTPLLSRDVGDRLRALHTPGDFAALAAGGTSLGIAPVKFLIEGTDPGGPLHLLSATRYPLHYGFVRDVIRKESPLDRCDPEQNAVFELGFNTFIATEYLNELTRSYLLGTLVHYVGPDLHTVEFTSGDRISATQIQTAFFANMARVPKPSDWSYRPVDEDQITRARSLEGKLPIVGPNAPYKGVRFQPLTAAVGYGTLKFVETDALPTVRLGSDVIVVTSDVPNDIGLVGGLITEAFQTPLSHVNLLSQARDTPNMALANARAHQALAPLFGELVRLEVTADGFSVTRAKPEEAQAFWQKRMPTGPLFRPERDTTLRGVVDLKGRGLADLPSVGAKAAQLAELYKVKTERSGCSALPVILPDRPFAIPLVHSIEHFQNSGAEQKLSALEKTAAFKDDPAVRGRGLAEVRALVASHPVDPVLLKQLVAAVKERYPAVDVRFRSSSNAEDLEGFNGAGLYTSESANLAKDEQSISDALRTVWASLWEQRAYDERSLAGIDRTFVAMGVLVHPRFEGERANGVAMSRNLTDPTRADQFFINAQLGEASVANPAPGVGTEQVVYTFPPNTPEIVYRSRSTLSQGAQILNDAEVRTLSCTLGALHDHFSGLMNADGKNRWFTIEVEFKLMSAARNLFIKQARPFPFSNARMPSDCR